MRTLLVVAALLAVAVGAAHTWLGERYILIRLFRRRDLPKLFGDDWFTRRTLRFAWHLTTIAWWGLAAQLLVAAGAPQAGPALLLEPVAWLFALSAAVTFAASRGRHLAWPAFLAIAGCIWLAF